MSIIKSVLHIFNGKTKSFDTYHPETEVAQVTDWNAGIVNTLASTGLSSLVSTLTSDSLLALLIKKVFDATGVKYSLGQNGYVCFGSLVGGLIIQWGLAVITNPVEKITLPLTSTMLIGIAGDGGNGNNSVGFNSSLYIYTTANVYPTGIAFIAICK